MTYLIYNTAEEAWNRSEEEGIRKNLAYHTGDPNGSRYVSSPFMTNTDEWALPIGGLGYELSNDEELQLVENVVHKYYEDGSET